MNYIEERFEETLKQVNQEYDQYYNDNNVWRRHSVKDSVNKAKTFYPVFLDYIKYYRETYLPKILEINNEYDMYESIIITKPYAYKLQLLRDKCMLKVKNKRKKI